MTTLYSPLMRRFRAISPADSRAVVRFCKQHEIEISNLSGDEYFAIWTRFLDALHDVGDWGYLLPVCEEILAYTIAENIKYYGGEDIYLKTLYLKALAHYHLYQTETTKTLLSNLLHLQTSPINQANYKKLLYGCLLRTRPTRIHSTYALAVFCYTLAVLAAAVRLFYVDPFAPYLAPDFDLLQWGLFAISSLILAIGYAWHRQIAWRKSTELIRIEQNKRRSK